MMANVTPSPTAPSTDVVSHFSPISSFGSLTTSTEPMRTPATTTGTTRRSVGGSINAANHAGAGADTSDISHAEGSAAPGAGTTAAGRTSSSPPAASLT